MRVLIPTCDKYMPCIEALQYSIRGTYLRNFEFIIIGYSLPEFNLDPNWKFVSMGEDKKDPKQWSETIIEFLKDFPDEHFIYGNDDCAISYLDALLLDFACDYAEKYKSIGRFALMSEGRNRPVVPFETGTLGTFPITPWQMEQGTRIFEINQFRYDADYRLSLGWSVYNKKCFLEFCKEGMTPWDFEISSCNGSNEKELSKWNFLTFNPTEGAIDGAFFRRKNIAGIIPEWYKGYYGHDLEGSLKEDIHKILFG